MGTFTIGEAADRSGFTASTLRYYEDIRLVVPTRRSDAGYRLYDVLGGLTIAGMAASAFVGAAGLVLAATTASLLIAVRHHRARFNCNSSTSDSIRLPAPTRRSEPIAIAGTADPKDRP